MAEGTKDKDAGGTATAEVKGPALPIPTKVLMGGKEVVERYRKNSAEKRKNILANLVNIKAVKLNTAKRILFDITDHPTSGKVVLSMSSGGTRTVRFGANGVPSLEQLPLHGLIAIANGLQSKDLINVSNGDQDIVDPMATRPPLSKESPDPMASLNPASKNKLIYMMNYENADSGPNGRPIGNSLENIMKYAKASPKLTIQQMICVEKDNKGRREVITALESLIHQMEFGESESKALAKTQE